MEAFLRQGIEERRGEERRGLFFLHACVM